MLRRGDPFYVYLGLLTDMAPNFWSTPELSEPNAEVTAVNLPPAIDEKVERSVRRVFR